MFLDFSEVRQSSCGSPIEPTVSKTATHLIKNDQRSATAAAPVTYLIQNDLGPKLARCFPRESSEVQRSSCWSSFLRSGLEWAFCYVKPRSHEYWPSAFVVVPLFKYSEAMVANWSMSVRSRTPIAPCRMRVIIVWTNNKKEYTYDKISDHTSSVCSLEIVSDKK